METLTKREKQVLIELLKKGRVTDQEIARKLKTSRPTILKIRRRLETRGIIRGYTTLINLEQMDLNVHAVILYQWRDYSKAQELAKFVSFVKSLPDVVLFIKGEGIGSKTDLIVALHKDLKDYETFIRKLKYAWKDNVENVEVFLSSSEGIVKGYDLASPILAKMEEHIIYAPEAKSGK